MAKDSQEIQILNDLYTGTKITQLDALKRYGCFRLSARIKSLRNEGFKIVTEMIEMNGKHVAQYYLKN